MFLRFDLVPEPINQSESLWLHVHLGLYGAWRFHAAPGIEVVAAIGAPRRELGEDVFEDTGLLPLGRRENEGLNVDSVEAATDGVWQAPEPVGAIRVRIQNDSVVADLAGPTACDVLTFDEVQMIGHRLGPDPLDTDSDPEALRKRFVENVRGSRRAISELVMDQSVVAGVGNIYRAEGLFRQGISPNRRGNNVSPHRLGELWDDYVFLLAKGVEEGRIITVRPGDKPSGDEVSELDPEALRWYVYHRTGRPCLICGREISEKTVQNRRLFWCSNCQR